MVTSTRNQVGKSIYVMYVVKFLKLATRQFYFIFMKYMLTPIRPEVMMYIDMTDDIHELWYLPLLCHICWSLALKRAHNVPPRYYHIHVLGIKLSGPKDVPTTIYKYDKIGLYHSLLSESIRSWAYMMICRGHGWLCLYGELVLAWVFASIQ